MSARFPGAFPEDGRPVLLKRGVHHDLNGLADPLPVGSSSLRRQRVHRFLYAWVSRPAYLAAMQPGAPRTALDGAPDGYVTDEEAATAAAELERRRQRKEVVYTAVAGG